MIHKSHQVVVIKIGSSVLMTHNNRLSRQHILDIARQIELLHQKNFQVVLITSGAVACGSNYVRLSAKPHSRQIAAGIGQIKIMCAFNSEFTKYDLSLAQILLTKGFFESDTDRNKLGALIQAYLKLGVIPIINENDILELNSFGGNDHLGAEIAQLIHAHKLLILSTMKGSRHGVGGGRTKQEVTEILLKRNIHTRIVDGKSKEILLQTLL